MPGKKKPGFMKNTLKRFNKSGKSGGISAANQNRFGGTSRVPPRMGRPQEKLYQ